MSARDFRANYPTSAGPSMRAQTTSGVVANTTINYTIQEDTHGGYSAGTYTVKVGGLYLVTVASKQSTSVGFGLVVQKNGANALYSPNAATTAFSGASITGLLRCAVNDTIRVQSNLGYTPQSDSPADNNYFHLVRVA